MSDFETVKQRADIVEVVEGYVSLRRKGRLFEACCPFHNERTPSFTVDPARQSWHCWGACSTGGDVISFVSRKENLSPVEALRTLAERYGVELSRRPHRDDEPATARLVAANEAAVTYYHHLLRHAAAAEPARAYLERRGVASASIDAFQLGFCLDGWHGLRDHLRERGYGDDELVTAGLLSKGERGVYDRFRGRVMFPIRDERGRAVGFGARLIGDGTPKYLNSPQSALFDKGSLLYALDRARDAIRDAGEAVVVEGYMDAITAHEFGITNVVATLGTALTERHLALLKRFARRVILAMDADAAGIEAALRGEELVRRSVEDGGDGPVQVVVDWRNLVRVQAAAPVEVRVFTVPQGKDPDEAIRADAAGFRELATRAVPPFEFRLRHELARIDRTSPRERTALADRLLPIVAAVADRSLQAQYLTQLAQATTIPEEVLLDRMRTARAAPAAVVLREPAAPPPRRAPKSDALRPSRGAARPAVERTPSAAPPGDDGPPPDDAPPYDDAPPPDEPPEFVAPAAAGRSAPAPPRPSAPPDGVRRRETLCLRLLLGYVSLRDMGLALDDDLFVDWENRALFATWKATGGDLDPDALDDALRARLSVALGERIPPWDDATAAKALNDAVDRLRLEQLQDSARVLAATIRETTDADPEAAARAVAALDGAGAEPDDTVTHLLTGLALARRAHDLEMRLRTHGPPAGAGGASPGGAGALPAHDPHRIDTVEGRPAAWTPETPL